MTETLPLQLENAEEKLKVVQTGIVGKPELQQVYKVSLAQPLGSEQSITVVVETVFAHAIFPFPKEITQNDRQLVQFTGNVYVLSPYPCKTQSTTVHLPTSSVESFTRVAPANVNDKDIVYGPYGDIAPFSNAKIIVHFENNGPFVGVVSLLRLIEVSHWGNIAVEEHIHVKHQGKARILLINPSVDLFRWQVLFSRAPLRVTTSSVTPIAGSLQSRATPPFFLHRLKTSTTVTR